MRSRVSTAFLALASVLASTSTAGLAVAQVEPPRKILDALRIRSASLQKLDLPSGNPGEFSVRVGLSGVERVLDLRAYDVRDSSFRLFVDDRGTLREFPKPASITYRGVVRGETDSVVAASLSGGRLHAIVRVDRPNGSRSWGVQSVKDLEPMLAPSLHVAYPTDANRPLDAGCGLDRVGALGRRVRNGGGLVHPQALLAELAVDADFDYYRRNGSSVTATQNRITTIVNAVDAIYKRDVDITLRITTMLVRTSATYTKADPRALVDEFETRWRRSHANVRRDVAHLFSGKGTFTGILGYARLGTVCVPQNAFSASRAYDTNLVNNVAIVAHQLAHNFDALHCDTASACNLMCSRFGGCSRNLTSFSQATKDAILAFKKKQKCLGSDKPPLIRTIAPASVKALGSSVIDLVGERMGSVIELRIGALRIGTTGFSNTATSLRFTLPTPTALGTFPVSIRSAAGISNTVNLVIRETKPVEHRVAGLTFGNQLLLFEFGGAANAAWVILVAPNNQTFKFMGVDVLQNFVVLSSGALSGAGLGSFTVLVPPTVKGTVWSQLATFKAGVIDGASTPRSTLIL